MEKPFTIEKLENVAGDTIFRRGKEYYKQGAVSDIFIKNGQYTANVYGTQRYEVAFNIDKQRTSCNCPYDGGFCKHKVAFGMKLLDEWDSLQIDFKNFNETFQTIDDFLKLQFLEKTLLGDTKLQNEFLRFCKFQTNVETEVDIEDVAEDIFDEMAFYAAEDIYDEMPTSHYAEPYETAADIIDDIIEEYEKFIIEYIENKQFRSALEYITGVLEGLSKASKTEIADFAGDLPDLEYGSIKKFCDALKTETEEMKKSILMRFFELAEKFTALRYWHSFSCMFDIFIQHKELASIISEKIKPYTKDDTRAMDILRQSEKKLGNKQNITKMAQENPDDFQLAMDYLAILKNEKNYDGMNKVLEYWFDKGKELSYRGRSVIEKFVIPELGEEKYKDYLEKCIKILHSFDAYKKLRKFIDEQEVLSLVSELDTYDIIHHIYLHEKWYDKILDVIKNKKKDAFYFSLHYTKYLKDIEHIYPQEAWNIHKKYIDEISSGKRNRNTYSFMAEELQYMKTLNAEKTREVIMQWYNRKPSLPALKDEFRKAGIV